MRGRYFREALFETAIRIVDAIVRDIWYVAGLGAALALVVLLLCRHVFESHLGPRTRTALNIALLPLFFIFVAFIVAGPLF